MISKTFRIGQVVHAGEHVPLVFAIGMAVCLLGILTRPLGFLAEFWPANALLLAMVDCDAADLEQSLTLADHALYEAKNSGRDRAVFSHAADA